MPQPVVSVVVSTYERPERLSRLLDGLSAQTLDPSDYEVIVVDNGSGPSTAAVLADATQRAGLPLRVIRHERTLGPAGGRNSGWRAARAALVAFTDDDCVPAAEWLEALLATAAAAPGAIIQGRTEPDGADPSPRHPLLARTRRIEQASPQYETCNIAYPRSILEALDGFDEGYGLRPAGEDTDLAWRAIERGHRVVFAPNALVHHAVVELDFGQAFSDAWRWGECGRLFARHPQAREILYRRVFWNAWHYLLIRSLLALPGPAWLRRLLLTRHLLALASRARTAGAGLVWVPYLLVLDAVETASMVRGALRHRTPLL